MPDSRPYCSLLRSKFPIHGQRGKADVDSGQDRRSRTARTGTGGRLSGLFARCRLGHLPRRRWQHCLHSQKRDGALLLPIESHADLPLDELQVLCRAELQGELDVLKSTDLDHGVAIFATSSPALALAVDLQVRRGDWRLNAIRNACARKRRRPRLVAARHKATGQSVASSMSMVLSNPAATCRAPHGLERRSSPS